MSAGTVAKYQAAGLVSRNIDLMRVHLGSLLLCRNTKWPVKCVETPISHVFDRGRCSGWLRRVSVRRAGHPALTHIDRIGATRAEAAHVSAVETPARCSAGTRDGQVAKPPLTMHEMDAVGSECCS